MQILQITYLKSRITLLADNIGFAAYKYSLELSIDNINLLEHQLYNVLSVLYKCTLWREKYRTITSYLISERFIFNFAIGITSFSAVIVQFCRYANGEPDFVRIL